MTRQALGRALSLAVPRWRVEAETVPPGAVFGEWVFDVVTGAASGLLAGGPLPASEKPETPWPNDELFDEAPAAAPSPFAFPAEEVPATVMDPPVGGPPLMGEEPEAARSLDDAVDYPTAGACTDAD